MASRYWIGGGTNSNWNAGPTTNWAATSGGAVRVAAPTSTDDVFFDGAGASGNSNSVLSGFLTIKSLTITSGYTSTITHNAGLVVGGNWTMHNGFTIAGTGAITVQTNPTIDSGGKAWPNNLTFGAGSTITLLNNNLVVLGTTQFSNGGAVTFSPTTSETFSTNGVNHSNDVNGTVKLILTGGTWARSSGAVAIDTDIQGNVTVSGTVFFGGNTKTLRYLSGTVTTTSSTLTLNTSCTLDTAGINWNNVTSAQNITVTNNSLFTVTGTLSFTSANLTLTFTGTAGFTCATLSITATQAGTITLKEGVTYTVTSALTANTSRFGSILIITSAHASTKAILTLNNGATCALLANLTRLDCSGGRPLRTFNGTITDCLNAQEFHDLLTVAA